MVFEAVERTLIVRRHFSYDCVTGEALGPDGRTPIWTIESGSIDHTAHNNDVPAPASEQLSLRLPVCGGAAILQEAC